MSKLSKYLNFIIPLRDFLYILQLEEYDAKRFLQQVGPRLLKRNFEVRDSLQITNRIRIISCTFLLLILFFLLILSLLSKIFLIIYVITLPVITPYLLAISSVLANYPISKRRQKRLKQAKEKFLTKNPDTKVIAITGSYGKTTTKYLLYSLLEHSFKVEMIDKNVNTSLGVANYILKNKLASDTEYLIVEMGAFVRGDVAELCQILPPDIAVLTKLGDQHLERFGSFQNLVMGKYEIFSEAKERAKKYTTKEAISILKEHNLKTEDIEGVEVPSDESGNKILSIRVAKDLGVSENFITDAIAKFKPPERRNRIYSQSGVTVIDNSYNISPQVANKVVHDAKQIANQEKKNLVVLTAGIAEQGEKNEETNRNFGLLLNEYASRVILNDSVYKAAILKGLKKPHEIVNKSNDVMTELTKYVNGQEEILLFLPEHSDLAYL